ncbi:MAG: hypothetical protein WC854_14275 [Bacteroidales bacterium]
MKAIINTVDGMKEVELSASYKYKGVDVFLTIEYPYAIASEWSTGCRITSEDMLEDRGDNDYISIIALKANAVLDIAIANGRMFKAIEKMVKEHGIANEGEMPLIGDVVIAEVSK